MADADEDLIPRAHPFASTSVSASDDPFADQEDEPQDFRFLLSLTSNSKANGASALPKRGEKDFEPNPTQSQSDTLAASRDAMRKALSVQRILPPRNLLVGQYLPNPCDWRWDTRPDADGKGAKGGRCVVVEKFSTSHGKSFGVADYRNWTWFLPEEALFLLERGTLEIRWPDQSVRTFMKGSIGRGTAQDAIDRTGLGNQGANLDMQVDDDGQEHSDTNEAVDIEANGGKPPRKRRAPQTFKLQVGEMPMSLQGAYASLIGKSGLTLERYNVYTGLRRLGYIVQRAPTWDNDDDIDDGEGDEQSLNSHAPEQEKHLIRTTSATDASRFQSLSKSNPAAFLVNFLVTHLFKWKSPLHYRPGQGPLIYPGPYENYNQIFRSLSLIPYHPDNHECNSDTFARTKTVVATKPRSPFTVSWFVYKPNPNTKFRKSDPPPPDFRIAVLDARTTCVPTAAELGALLDSMPPDELAKDKRMEQRLKHGLRHVILAVVDCGLVSYLRAADMCSGSEGKLYELKTAAAATKGGKRSGGGRKPGGRKHWKR